MVVRYWEIGGSGRGRGGSVGDVVVVHDRFYIALFSALEQTH